MLRVIAIVTLAWFICSSTFAKADLIVDDFEDQSNSSGDGTPTHYFTFGGQLLDRGVNSAFGAGNSNFGAFYVINFSVENSFGVGAARENINVQLSPSDCIVVDIKLVSGNTPAAFVAFRLQDNDGTVLRTRDSDLFQIDSSYGTIYQQVSLMTKTDFTGTVEGLNLSNLRSIGLLFFDRDFSGNATIAFDNLRVSAVPEPPASILLASVLLPTYKLMRVQRWVRQRRFSLKKPVANVDLLPQGSIRVEP